jgi:hypothetical protein
MPPESDRGEDLLMADSTITTLFGGTESLKNFWRNLARMR